MIKLQKVIVRLAAVSHVLPCFVFVVFSVVVIIFSLAAGILGQTTIIVEINIIKGFEYKFDIYQ